MTGTHSLTHAKRSIEKNPQWGEQKQICEITSGRDTLPVLWPSFEGSLKSKN